MPNFTLQHKIFLFFLLTSGAQMHNAGSIGKLDAISGLDTLSYPWSWHEYMGIGVLFDI